MSALLATLLAAGLVAQAPVETPPTPNGESPDAGATASPDAGATASPDAGATASPDAGATTQPPTTRPREVVRRSPRTRVVTKAERKAAAQKAYRKGQKLYGKSRYAAAIVALRRALAHWPYREIHFNLALCYREQKDWVRAYHHLLRYLKGATARERRSVPRALRRLRRRVGMVVVHSSDFRAEIWVGGRLAGRGRVDRVVKPGTVVIEVKRNGKTVKLRELHVPRGGTATWDVSLGRVVTQKPNKSRRRRLLHWRYAAIAGGVAVVATVLAVGFGARTAKLHDEFDRDPTWSTRDQGLRFQTLTNVMWGLAGVAAVSTAALAVFTRWRREKPRVRILPVITPTGVTLTGSF